MSASTPDNSNAKQIAGYRLEEKIGKGGMGHVFRARQVSMDRVVALKVLSPKLSKNEIFTKRFMREAHSAGKLNHANIVQAIEVGQSDDGYYFFSMEFVDGETLKATIKRMGALSERRALEIIYYIAHGLEHAHQAGLIHRDIKPDNILIAVDGTPKLADFGLAKAPDDTTVTQAGTVIGTPAYISPEQAQGIELDIRADIYSLGATLYHAVVGQEPFKGETAGVIFHKQIHEKAVPANEANPEVSANTSKLIERMMEKDPVKRHQSPAELIQDLELVMRGEAPRGAKAYTGIQEAVKQRKAAATQEKKSSAMPFAFLILLAIGGAGFWFTQKAGKNETVPPTDASVEQLATTPDANVTTIEAVAATTIPDVAEPGSDPPDTTPEIPKALRDAQDYVKAQPTDLMGQINRYQAVQSENQGLPAANVAAAAVAEIQKRWDLEAAKVLTEISEQMSQSITNGAFGDAVKALDQFPERLRNEKWEGQANALRKLVVSAAEKEFEKIEAEAVRAATEGNTEEAIKLYSKAMTFGVERIVDLATEAIDTIKAEVESAQGEFAVLQEKSDYLAFWLEVSELVADKNYTDALSRLEKITRRIQSDDVLADLKKDVEEIRKLDGLKDKVEAGCLTYKVGQFIVIGQLKGTFKGYADGRITVSQNNGEGQIRIENLSEDERFRIAQRALNKDNGEADYIRALLAVYSTTARPGTAARYIKAASQKGADVSQLVALVERREIAAHEAEARKLYRSAAKTKRNGLRRDGPRRINMMNLEELIEKYSDSFVYRANRKVIEAHLAAAVRWPRVEKGLICGWVSPAFRGQAVQKSDWYVTPTTRGQARFTENGELNTAGGAFLVPEVNNRLLLLCRQSNELTIESIFRPADLKQIGPARIVSFSTDGSSRNFTLGQSGGSLVLRIRTSETGPSGNGQEVTLCSIPEKLGCHVIVTYASDRLECHLNGKRVFESEKVRGDFSTWNDHFFVVGDEYKDARDWAGIVTGFAIYNRALGPKEIAAHFKAMSKSEDAKEDE